MGLLEILRSAIAEKTSSQWGASVGNLHERVVLDLAQEFPGSRAEIDADLVIRQGSRVAVVEVKTGNPELPLPSSTSSQMRLLAKRASHECYGSQVFPVLVTNYRVTEVDRKELEAEVDGIKIVQIASVASLYKPQDFSRDFAEIVGLQAHDTAASAS